MRILSQLSFVVVILAIIMPLLMPLHPAYASNLTQAAYKATVDVNATGTYYNQTANFTLSTAILQANNYLNPSCNNSSIQSDAGADVAFMPAAGSNTSWTLWVDSVTSTAHKNYFLYTGGTINMESKLRYFPGNAGMTTIDAADIEPANNYSISVKGYIDTSVLGNPANAIINKTNAFSISKNQTVAGKIEAIVYSDLPSLAGTNSVNLTPSANGVLTQNTPVGGTNYAVVSDANDGYYIYNDTTSYKTDFFTVTPSTTIPSVAIINYVKIWYRTYDSTTDSLNYQPKLYLNGNTQLGTEILDGSGDVWTYHSENISRPGGKSWTPVDISSLQIGIGLKYNSGTWTRAACTKLYAEVSYTYTPVTLLVTGISSGEHTVTLSCNTTNTVLAVDSSTNSNGAVSINNSTDNWTTGVNNAMPYIDYQSISINGTLKQLVKWTDSTTFTDLTGNGHNTTPSFALSPNITATITDFAPLSASVSPITSDEETADLVTNFSAPAANYASENMTPGIIGADILNTMMDAGQVPRSFVWFIIAFGLAIGAGLLAYKLISKGAGHTSSALLTQAIVSGVVLSIFSIGSNNVVPWYCVIIFVIEALGIILAQKQTGW